MTFQVPYAHVESVHRQAAGHASPGDRARVRLDPGIIELLEVELAGSAIGTGYRPRHTVPFGVAATAAYALVVPFAEGRSWTGRDVEVEWLAEADPQDVLFAEAELTAIDEGLACFTFRASTRAGRSLLSGTLRLSAIREGKVLPTALLPPRRPDGPGPELEAARLLAAVAAPAALGLGRTAEVRVTVANTAASRREVVVTAQKPFGAGLSLDSDESVSRGLEPGATSVVVFRIRADRPDEVNLSRPWPLLLTARTGTETDSRIVSIAVPDPEPGRVFYVLTEDCETFDGGPLTGDYGSLAALGNGNNFMDPEEYRIQMIAKPGRMNEIADRHGARWTHFWCAPQRFAVDWAIRESNTGAWEALARELDESVRQGAVRHEYAPHLHFDYEPDSHLPPQPRLVYDAATDGILPNDYYHPVTNPRHHWHDWDGSGRGISYIKNLGDLRHLDSKAGSLYKTQRFLARLSAHRRYALVARTGGCDFGVTAEDQEISTQAFEANGLRGNSDARTGSRAPRGNQMYWCDAGDRLREIGELSAARLVQLGITLETDFADAEGVNRWFASAWDEASGPGVRVLMTMTHAMFMRGEPDPFRSLAGGAFGALDQHLDWVRTHYPSVHFATASEALVEYLDYYTPSLEAFVEPGLCGGNPREGRYEYAVRLLGNGIRVDARHPATIRVTTPPWFDAGELARLRVIADGSVLAEKDQFDAAVRPSVECTLSARPSALRLEVEVRPEAVAALASSLPASVPYIDPPEPRRGPLFRLGRPYSGDLLRLLMNPVGGHAEPLGRRIHPLGVYAMGVALTAALPPRAGGPCRLWLRWRKSIALEATLSTAIDTAGDHTVRVRILDDAGDTIADSQVWFSAEQLPPAAVSRTTDTAGDRFAAAMDETLHVYRAQRAWRVMLWVRKGYAVATRQGLLAFLRWLPAALAGRGDIDSEELSFPRWDQFRRPR